MNSVERIKYYTELQQEGTALDVPGTTLRSAVESVPGWPHRPTIVFEKVAASYRRELGRVLDDVTISIEAGEKTAVVGRTGSGKSTLMLLLFRFLELDAGTIFIDGLDIAKLKLSELRQNIAILPQEPILFGGSVRENLDPFEEHVVRTHFMTKANTLQYSAIFVCHDTLRTLVRF
jgi:ABC-type multidrug transport system fused ATPase/permease subunit